MSKRSHPKKQRIPHESMRQNNIDKSWNRVYLKKFDAGSIRAGSELLAVMYPGCSSGMDGQKLETANKMNKGGPIAQLVEPPAHNR